MALNKMVRRDFITRIALTGGALSTGIGCSRKIKPSLTVDDSKEEVTIRESGKLILEPSRQIPVFAETDILVIGGGPAGVAAAIAAGKTGAETYLVERYNHLGGLWTGGIVLPLFGTHVMGKGDKWEQVMYGIGGEIAGKLKEIGMSIYDHNPVVDPEAAKYVLDGMVREAGVKMLYHTWGTNVIMDGNIIKGVFLESKSGRLAILAKVVIDCSGDGDIFFHAGENYEVMKYRIGLNHRLGNIDRIDTKKPGYVKMKTGDPTPIPSVNWVNMGGKDNQDALDVLTLSQLQMDYRREIWESVQKIRQTPGYEEVFLLDTAPQLGVRISRILDGEYKLTLDDTMTYKKFDDVIGISGAWWTNMFYQGKKIEPSKRPMWQIPYRSLLPKKTENLLVAGRCFSFTRNVFQDARIIGTCLITGHAAGAAAGMAVRERETVREINVKNLQKLLTDQGAWLNQAL